MIYYVVVLILVITTHGEPRPFNHYVILLSVSHDWEIVKNQIDLVKIINPLLQDLYLLFILGLSSAKINILVHIHMKYIRGGLDLVTHEKLTQILCTFFWALWKVDSRVDCNS